MMNVHTEALQLVVLVHCFASCAAQQDPPASSPVREPVTREQAASAAPEPAPSGGLNPAQIARVVMAAQADMSACYALSPSSAEGLAGSITIGWEMAPSGEVRDIAVSRTEFADEGLADCLVEKLKQLRYAVAAQPTRASWTFRFEP